MLKHADVWRAIDRLAQEHGMSPSGLARKAGLDPTTFNKSKRITREGRPRWPSTESISKILAATESTLAQFVDHVAYG
jgi:phage repressor protein C with HTH and peptisase S24 domain